MDSNTTFQQRLQAGQAQFFLADLHVHSPASPCFGNGGATPFAKEIAEHEQRVLDSYPVGTFYDELVQHRNTTIQHEHLPAREDWAVIAITDHNACTYACRLSRHAWQAERLRTNRLILLPGMELSVDFRVPGTQQCASAHLLLIFQPLVPLDGLEDAADHLLDESLQPGAVLLDDRLLGSGNERRLGNEGVLCDHGLGPPGGEKSGTNVPMRITTS